MIASTCTALAVPPRDVLLRRFSRKSLIFVRTVADCRGRRRPRGGMAEMLALDGPKFDDTGLVIVAAGAP